MRGSLHLSIGSTSYCTYVVPSNVEASSCRPARDEDPAGVVDPDLSPSE
jgi:hypothetical protein